MKNLSKPIISICTYEVWMLDIFVTKTVVNNGHNKSIIDIMSCYQLHRCLKKISTKCDKALIKSGHKSVFVLMWFLALICGINAIDVINLYTLTYMERMIHSVTFFECFNCFNFNYIFLKSKYLKFLFGSRLEFFCGSKLKVYCKFPTNSSSEKPLKFKF